LRYFQKRNKTIEQKIGEENKKTEEKKKPHALLLSPDVFLGFFVCFWNLELPLLYDTQPPPPQKQQVLSCTYLRHFFI
jgi:hypothetical protein